VRLRPALRSPINAAILGCSAAEGTRSFVAETDAEVATGGHGVTVHDLYAAMTPEARARVEARVQESQRCMSLDVDFRDDDDE
jgi:hypothetical protein